MIKTKQTWMPNYVDPLYWNARPPSWKGMPKLINLYIDLTDNKLRKFLNTKKGKILDLGCGEGRFLPYSDVGIDFSIGMIKRAKKKGKSLICASVLNLPFKSKSFDVAFSVEVLFFLAPNSRERFFKEAKRVSKTVYFIEMPRTYFHSFYLSFYSKIIWRLMIPLFLLMSFFIGFAIDRLRRAPLPLHPASTM